MDGITMKTRGRFAVKISRSKLGAVFFEIAALLLLTRVGA